MAELGSSKARICLGCFLLAFAIIVSLIVLQFYRLAEDDEKRGIERAKNVADQIYRAEEVGNLSKVYELVHPDRQALWGPQEEYLNKLVETEDFTIASISQHNINGAKKMGKFFSKGTGKTYSNVIVVWADIVMNSELEGCGIKPIAVKDIQYFARVKGHWLSLGDGKPLEE